MDPPVHRREVVCEWIGRGVERCLIARTHVRHEVLDRRTEFAPRALPTVALSGRAALRQVGLAVFAQLIRAEGVLELRERHAQVHTGTCGSSRALALLSIGRSLSRPLRAARIAGSLS